MQISFTNEEQARLSQAAADDGKLEAELAHDLIVAGLGVRPAG
jgi:hypothetical protein